MRERGTFEGQFLYEAACQRLMKDNKERLLGRLRSRLAWFRAEAGVTVGTIDALVNRSISIAQHHNNQRECVMAMIARGWYLMRPQMDFDGARQQFQQALAHFDEREDLFFVALLLHRIGYCYHHSLGQSYKRATNQLVQPQCPLVTLQPRAMASALQM